MISMSMGEEDMIERDSAHWTLSHIKAEVELRELKPSREPRDRETSKSLPGDDQLHRLERVMDIHPETPLLFPIDIPEPQG